MELAVVIGNTTVSMGVFGEGEMLTAYRFPVDRPAELEKAFREVGKRWVEQIAVASVNPPANRSIVQRLQKAFGLRPRVVGKHIPIDMKIRCKKSERVGVDRLLNAVAAFEKYGGPVVIVDAGTAITIDVVSAKGYFLGGAIAPGLGLSAVVLHERTAKLPLIKPRKPRQVPGRDTEEAMNVGIYWGAVGGVEKILRAMRGKYGRCKIVATGGDADLLARDIPLISVVVPHLALEGICIELSRHCRPRPGTAKMARRPKG